MTLTSDDLRTAFIRFLERNDHQLIADSSLIPKNDPTLLFMNSGMAPLKPYFTGDQKLPGEVFANAASKLDAVVLGPGALGTTVTAVIAVPASLASEFDGGPGRRSELRKPRRSHLRSRVPIERNQMKRRHEQADTATNDLITEQDSGDLHVPYESLDFDMSWADDRIGIAYDRVPKGDCEVRRNSEVIGANKQTLGHVVGFVSDDDHLVAIAVRTGIPGFGRTVLVPFGAIGTVGKHRVKLTINKAQFELLPKEPKFRLGS